MRRRTHSAGLLVFACLLAIMGTVSRALAEPTRNGQALPATLPEYALKAAYVYNFAKFAEWPEGAFQGAGAPMRLCVLGQDPFDGALDSIAGKSVQSRELVISYPIWAEEARFCHILFISDSVNSRLPEIMTLLDGSPILTIGDTPGIALSGGVIGLENVGNRVRFQVNLDAAQRSGIRLSSRLLNLATVVHNERFSGTAN